MYPISIRNSYGVGGAVKRIAQRLTVAYNDNRHGNLRDPFDELIYVILSTKTDERSYREVYLEFKKAFPTRKDLLEADDQTIVATIERGGLAQKKGRAIKRIAERCRYDFGRVTLTPLKTWPDQRCEDYLTSLPGVGKKVARCVMMYSLDRPVFPVDAHCWRIALRLGWISPRWKHARISPRDEDELQNLIPPQLRYSLHVNLVTHGRTMCTSRSPQCQRCPLSDMCPKLGIRSAC